MADQVQFQGSAQSLGFKPIEQVNALPLIKENHQRFLQAEQTKFELEQTYAKTRQFVDNNNIQSLADFSSTLSDMLVEETKKQNERDMEEGVMQAYLDGVDPAESMAFDIAEGYLKTNDDQLQTIGDAAQASGAPFMGVQKLRELSGWKAYGYAMGMAQNAGTAYAAYMEEALANVPMDADPSEKAVYLSNARAQFLKQSGLMGMNPALLNKYSLPKYEGS